MHTKFVQHEVQRRRKRKQKMHFIKVTHNKRLQYLAKQIKRNMFSSNSINGFECYMHMLCVVCLLWYNNSDRNQKNFSSNSLVLVFALMVIVRIVSESSKDCQEIVITPTSNGSSFAYANYLTKREYDKHLIWSWFEEVLSSNHLHISGSCFLMFWAVRLLP